ncbi:hypothetical protein FKG94_05090 [Exilibacterium tricleocarpae]|uniref:Toxin CptA n=1 Tax=Exilibacterium tricleocarpae TaxID=2591008 RepID=A0A545U3R1_9GAMM|nr:protein YgfX [Exilibacterium tricleocarpae]TQV84043.1 hypothetical protein FKG94_05090 [Exilibacterium tricleocarpae]
MIVTPENTANSHTRLAITLQPSRQLVYYAVACHLLAITALLLAALPWLLVSVAAPALGWHLCHWLRRHRRRLPSALYCEGERWSVDIDRRNYSLTLAGEQVIWPWLIIMRGRLATRRACVLVLPPDAADPDDLRRLRVRLRAT